MPKFGTKNVIFCYFWSKMPYFGTFRLEFLKNYCHFWNQHPQICLFANFHEKLGTKNAWFWFFSTGVWKQYCHTWNQHPRICQIAKFHKNKMPIFDIKNAWCGYFWKKNALFRCFWARILKNYCHIWYPHPQICLFAKFCEKTKMPKLGTKNVLFGYFWARIF